MSPQTLIEKHLGRNSAIGTTEHNHFRMLIFRERVAQLHQVASLAFSPYVPLVAGHQVCPDLFRRGILWCGCVIAVGFSRELAPGRH